MELAEVVLSDVRAVLFDMDGVIYVGDRGLAGVSNLLNYLDATQREWMFITNNSTMTSRQFSEKLAGMGVRAAPEHIFGSAEATALWLAERVSDHGWPRGKVIYLGQEGLRSALADRGFELTDDPFAATYAVCGIDFGLTYQDLADIALAIRNGARFVATNDDRTFPSERGLIPGTGSIVALLHAATGQIPMTVGKPNAPMFESALHRLGAAAAHCLMVGDRYETDIAGALKLGLTTAAVLTGIDTHATFLAQTRPPHLIVAGLPDLLAAFRRADAAH